MDVDKMQVNIISKREDDQEDDDVQLPGFRFHPTDEELVAFYLRRKVDKKLPIQIDLIKQIDIYKYDPWDLPQVNDVGNKEWYFFCKRGRKYRNSIRPNRVTRSGFWKATGIDRPIYSGSGSVCIGLKKCLVYYRGSAGKGTKTEWMMHEFRLPPPLAHTNISHTKIVNKMDDISHEAEVWTLCRILKRNMSHKKTLPDSRQFSAKTKSTIDVRSKTYNNDMQNYIRFHNPIMQLNHGKNPYNQQHEQQNDDDDQIMNQMNVFGPLVISTSTASDRAPSASSSCFSDHDMNEISKHGVWDDLRSIVEFAASDQPVFFM